MESEKWKNQFRIGQMKYFAGCFTFEDYIKNQNLDTIAYLLGFPQWMVAYGVYVAYPIRIPNINEFELAGLTLDSTDKFVDYFGISPRYDHKKFGALYSIQASTPVNFKSIKKYIMILLM